MEFDAAALAEALRSEEAARAKLAATQADYERAQALANRENTGNTFFSALGNNAVRTRGRQQVNELEPRLKRAREQAASTYGARDLYNAEVQADQRQYSRGRDSLSDERYDQETQRSIAQQERENEWREGQETRALNRARAQAEMNDRDVQGGGVLYEDPATGEQIAVFTTASGPVDAEGNPVERRFIPVDRTAASRSGGSGASPASRRAATTLLNNRDAIERIATTASEFTPTELRELQDLRARFGKQLASEMTPQAWNQMMQGEFESYTPRIREFLNQVRRLNAEERNRLFGSALTETEVRTSEGFMPGAQGLSLDDIMLRLSEMDAAYRSGLENIDLTNNTNYLTAKEYNALSDWEKAQADREAALENEAAAASLPQTNDRGWELWVDAEGNRAYVNPENPNQFEEVQ